MISRLSDTPGDAGSESEGAENKQFRHKPTVEELPSTAPQILQSLSFNPLKRGGVRSLHFKVFSAIQV